MFDYAFLILLLPFLSALVLGLAGMKMPKPVAGIIGTCMLGVLFALSFTLLIIISFTLANILHGADIQRCRR